MSGPPRRLVDLDPPLLTSRERGSSKGGGGHGQGATQRTVPVREREREQGQTLCHGPHKFVDVRVLPLDLCQDVINDLVGTNETEMRSLFDRLLYLPELDSSLQLRLPGILTPDIDRAITEIGRAH